MKANPLVLTAEELASVVSAALVPSSS
jgi:hypothetical protein